MIAGGSRLWTYWLLIKIVSEHKITKRQWTKYRIKGKQTTHSNDEYRSLHHASTDLWAFVKEMGPIKNRNKHYVQNK